jgi:hypothetical protein
MDNLRVGGSNRSLGTAAAPNEQGGCEGKSAPGGQLPTSIGFGGCSGLAFSHGNTSFMPAYRTLGLSDFVLACAKGNEIAVFAQHKDALECAERHQVIYRIFNCIGKQIVGNYKRSF